MVTRNGNTVTCHRSRNWSPCEANIALMEISYDRGGAPDVPAIFERVRLTIPNVTLEEVRDAIMQSLPHGGQRQ